VLLLVVKVFEATPLLTIYKLTGNCLKKDFTRKNNLTFLPQTDIMRHYNLLKPAEVFARFVFYFPNSIRIGRI
jgi:hypothetical protein